MIRIAIDGPGGAGKSSVAKAVASKLQIIYVDTGALYRTIGLYMLEHGIDPKDPIGVASNLNSFTLELKFIDGRQVILLDGVDVGDTIRAPEVSMAASAVSAIKEVRDYLLNMQRSVAQRHSVIMDGRDIGTVILPNAEIKIFLTASPEARAKRRYDELIAKGKSVTYEQVYNEMVERDRNDSTRDIAPCKPADDSFILDNSDMTAEQTVDAVVKIVNDFRKSQKKNGYMKTHALVSGLIRFFYGVRVHGFENIPEEGGYLLCANHIAVRDVFLIAASAKRQIRFIAKKELFSIPILKRIITALGAIKLDRGGADVAAIRKSVNLLTDGELVAIFPQGHRYPSVEPGTTPRKNGAGLIAYKSKCDVIPVCIKVKNHKYGIFKRVDIIFGSVIPYQSLGLVNGGNDEYKNATDIIFEEIVTIGGFEKKSSSAPSSEN